VSAVDDNTSGGLKRPIFFDDVITFPLPAMSCCRWWTPPVARGRRVDRRHRHASYKWSNNPDGGTATLFNTAAMVAALDTTIFISVRLKSGGFPGTPVNVGVLTQIIASGSPRN
jgi:hypothetical protein